MGFYIAYWRQSRKEAGLKSCPSLPKRVDSDSDSDSESDSDSDEENAPPDEENNNANNKDGRRKKNAKLKKSRNKAKKKEKEKSYQVREVDEEVDEEYEQRHDEVGKFLKQVGGLQFRPAFAEAGINRLPQFTDLSEEALECLIPTAEPKVRSRILKYIREHEKFNHKKSLSHC